MDKFFKKLEEGEGVVLVDFSTIWCAPCNAQKPIIKDLTTQYQKKASIIEIDIDKHRALAEKYKVQSIPTLIIFKNGRETKRFVGLQSKAIISKSLDEALDSLPEK